MANPWFVAVILVSSLLNAVYFFRVLENLYAKPSAKETAVRRFDAPASMLAPTIFAAVALIVLGLCNSIIVAQVLEPIAQKLYAG